jgi:hypothetical protein
MTVVLIGSLGAVPATASTFTPGDVYWGDNSDSPGALHNVSAGGDFSSATPHAALPGRTPGQIAWSSDLTTAYVTMFDLGTVVAVTATGSVSTFAAGFSGPTGLLRTRDGSLYVAEYDTGDVFDITSGIATPFASGLSGPRNMVELSSGEILISEQGSGQVTDLSGGGDLTAALPFASGLGANADVVQDSAGRIFVSQWGLRQVMDITAGGDFSLATPFATGQTFMGLAVDGGGRLLASELFGPNVYDITAGGDFSAAMPFAFSLNSGESALDTVPAPEPSAFAIAATVLLLQATLAVRKRNR